jgi:DNA-binding CsgD family transcriptional regulator
VLVSADNYGDVDLATSAAFCCARSPPEREIIRFGGCRPTRPLSASRQMAGDGWSALFASAFNHSRNPMVLVDGERRIVDANGAFVRLLSRPRRSLLGCRLYTLPAGEPPATAAEWRDALAQGRFNGEATLGQDDGSPVHVQWAGCTEIATGRRLVLFVALTSSRWGARFRRESDGHPRRALSARERVVVHRVALGETGPEIAAELGIAHETVRTHVRNAMGKLGARSRAHLVAKALGVAIAGQAVIPQ